MRLALVGDLPPPSGGIAVHLSSLAEALGQQGNEVEVLDTSRVRSLPRFVRRLASLAARGFLIHVHTAGHNSKSWALAGAVGLARAPWRRNVVTLHSGLLPGYLAQMPGRQRVARHVLGRFGRVVGVSRDVVNALAEARVDLARLVELPAFSRASINPGVLPHSARRAHQRFPLLLCASLAPSPVYGARVLATALALLRQTRSELGCAVFGPESGHLVRELSALGLGEGLVALGELNHGEALAVMASSALFVRPTLIDGDALTVREALALGIRTVASDAARRPAGVKLFRSGDPFALAEAIRIALEGPAPEGPGVDCLPRLVEMYRELSRTPSF